MYETLLTEAYREQVEVVYLPFSKNIRGLYHNNVIAINSNLQTSAEKNCILAEELGHYYTSVGDILDQSILMNRKQEQRALRWSYERLVPWDRLITAYRSGVKTCHELAEYFDVTETFLISTLRYYTDKYGFYKR